MDNDGPNARHQHSHQDVEYRRVEVITGRRRRRDWTAEEKAEILAASAAPGLWSRRWRAVMGSAGVCFGRGAAQAMDELAAETAPRFVPLRIEGEAGRALPLLTSEPAATAIGSGIRSAGSIEIAIGRARVRVEGAVDPEVLRQVLGLIGPAR